ncbi:MAG: thioredoxin domain-containing protein [Cyanobacteria bacterium P01_F01_bin.53]
MMTTVTEENFAQEVLASSVPVLVHFRAPWCSICRLITPIVTSVQAEWPGQLRLFDVNADENFKLANQYQLKTLPTLLYMEKGRIIRRIEGFTSRDAFRSQLQDLAYRHHLESSLSSSRTA